MSDTRRGLVCALMAVILWGLFPAYWKWLEHVDSVEVLMHRNIWCVVVLLCVVVVSMRRRSSVLEVLRSPRVFALHGLSGALVGFNWGLYIWSVANERVVEASLGYFLAPLFSVALGAIVLGETLNRVQRLAVALAALGVAIIAIGSDTLPWIGIGLGVSFGFYGLLRKRAPTGPVSGLFLETLALVPISIAWLAWQFNAGDNAFAAGDALTTGLLLGGGLVTALPLLAYGVGARSLPLGLLGILFYITPSLQFLLGWLLYDEPISTAHWIGFAAIWTGLFAFSASALNVSHSATRVPT